MRQDPPPIVVDDYTGTQALTIACGTCLTTRVIGPDELNNEDLYPCPVGCGGRAGMAYWVRWDDES